MVNVAAGADAEARRDLFAAANAAEGFASLSLLEGDAAWHGVLAEPGRLRLVATGPGLLRVAVLDAR